jgi:hypothetical protein
MAFNTIKYHSNIFMLTLILVFYLQGCTAPKFEDKLHLEKKLSGSWTATAFSGELRETWRLGADGWMQQHGIYIENHDTLYSAHTKIEQVGGEVILFSVIRAATPRIFKAVTVGEDEIIFENNDYKDPYQVTYTFLDDTSYQRTIRRIEKDSLEVYTFNFKRVD